jgi:prefoldin subunit 5
MYSYLFNRVLKFDGGLSEQSSAPAESAIVRNNPIQGSLKLEVERALAEIRVAKAEIELLTQQTTDLGDDVASILVEVDSIKNTVSSHTGQISQLTQDVDGLTLEITSVDEDLQQVKTVFQETADGFVISKTVNVGGTETKTASISSIFEGGVTPVLIIDDGSNETAKIYANNIDISNGRFVNSLTAGTHKITHYTKDGVDWTIFQKITRG